MFILGAIGSTFASVGELYGTPENASMVALVGFLLVAFLLAALVYAVYAINKTKVDLHGFKKADKSIVRKYQRLSNELEKEYNAKSGPIWAEYKKKKPKANTDDEKKKLSDEYQDRLDDIKNEFRPRGKAIETDCFNEETALCKEWLDKLPSSLMWLQWAVRAICIVALLILTFMVFFHLGAQDYGKADATSPVNGWTATTIKLPHLTDGSRYVANPDGVLSAEAEDAINTVSWASRVRSLPSGMWRTTMCSALLRTSSTITRLARKTVGWSLCWPPTTARCAHTPAIPWKATSPTWSANVCKTSI